ncbi:hypothetical protein AMTR_s00126p00091560 [Amborella trichopoda]|uniref:Uncharacterized protein n=1 Tax=Amborella trichopoda TaxID=13333 RepID=W1NQP8_AMBTC|nr:hypothetical protein AMTR_s00126p00091560 [Amborella trichopoda]
MGILLEFYSWPRAQMGVVLFMAQSPDGCTVASARADETLRFQQVFGAPKLLNSKPEAKTSFGPINNINQIR